MVSRGGIRGSCSRVVGPYLHEIRVGDIELDVWFAAIDDTKAEAQFRSLEPTGWWWNELEFADMPSFFAGHGRVGRYPRAIDGGSRWSGTIADLNAPPESHWLPKITGEVPLPDDMSPDDRMAFERPPELAYFVQPPALLEVKDGSGRVVDWRVNPEAENLRWLADQNADSPEEIPGENYYRRARRGKPIRWIQANLANKIVPRVEGDPVWPSFDEHVHMATEPLEPVPYQDVVVGMDFGRRPAAVFSQTINGQRQYQFDAALENAGATKFAPVVREVLALHYPWVLARKGELRIWGDPKGQDRTQADEHTAYDVFDRHGLRVQPAPVPGNNIQTRIEAVEYKLDLLVRGRPAIVISPPLHAPEDGVQWRLSLPEGTGQPDQRAQAGQGQAFRHRRLGSIRRARRGCGAGDGREGKEAAAGQFGATAPLETEGQGLRQPNPKMAIFCQP